MPDLQELPAHRVHGKEAAAASHPPPCVPRRQQSPQGPPRAPDSGLAAGSLFHSGPDGGVQPKGRFRLENWSPFQGQRSASVLHTPAPRSRGLPGSHPVLPTALWQEPPHSALRPGPASSPGHPATPRLRVRV